MPTESNSKGADKMKNLLRRLMGDESGVTALETAIILIAFVVVAAIFAFTILSTGTFLTERSKEAAYAGLQEVRGSMELKGSLVLNVTGQYIIFNVATVAGGSSVDLSKVTVTYRDTTHAQNIAYLAGTTTPGSNQWIATDAAGTTQVQILSPGQLATVTIMPPAAVTANTTFGIEIKPPTGGVLLIERTAPAQITAVTDLH
jgi:archaeal flagellin FlaB